MENKPQHPDLIFAERIVDELDEKHEYSHREDEIKVVLKHFTERNEVYYQRGVMHGMAAAVVIAFVVGGFIAWAIHLPATH